MSELRKLAEAAKEWSNVTEIRSDRGDYGCTIGGMVDGEFYPVVTVECESYYADSMPLAAYIAAANPATVIGLMDEIDRLRNEAVAADIRIANDALVIAGLTAERDAAQADAKRLEWLSQQGVSFGFQDIYEGNKWEIGGPYATLRIAIDAEMKGEQP